MAKKTEEVGTEFLLEIIGTIDDDEKAAFDALRRFVESVDSALPGGGKQGAPSRRVKLVEAAMDMIEQLLGVSNEAAERLTNSIRKALPQFEAAARAAVEKASAKKASAKKASAKKASAKKASAKKASAKKAPAKKAPAKKAPAKKAPAKKAPAKK